jgi:hypothetical protein
MGYTICDISSKSSERKFRVFTTSGYYRKKYERELQIITTLMRRAKKSPQACLAG